MFVFLSYHKSSYILQKDQWNSTLITQFHKVCTFECGLRKQDPVIGYNTDRVAVNVCKSSHQCCSVKRLEFMKFRCVNQPRNHFTYIKKLPVIYWENSMQFLLRIKWIYYRFCLHWYFFFTIQSCHYFPGNT